MRDDIAYDYVRQRPSRLSRVVVLLSTLGVAAIAIWVATPILRANYIAYSTNLTTAPAQTAPAQWKVVPAPAATAAVAAPAASAPASTASTATPATAAVYDPAAPAGPAVASTTGSFNSTRAISAWPSADPAPQFAPQAPAETAPVAEPAPAAVANDPPAPPATPGNMRLASVASGAAAVDPAANVPLPRSRPSRMIAARLAIPLPRPRPDIPEEAPAQQRSTFDLQVDRMK
jgi:hypothetical protein